MCTLYIVYYTMLTLYCFLHRINAVSELFKLIFQFKRSIVMTILRNALQSRVCIM